MNQYLDKISENRTVSITRDRSPIGRRVIGLQGKGYETKTEAKLKKGIKIVRRRKSRRRRKALEEHE